MIHSQITVVLQSESHRCDSDAPRSGTATMSAISVPGVAYKCCKNTVARGHNWVGDDFAGAASGHCQWHVAHTLHVPSGCDCGGTTSPSLFRTNCRVAWARRNIGARRKPHTCQWSRKGTSFSTVASTPAVRRSVAQTQQPCDTVHAAKAAIHDSPGTMQPANKGCVAQVQPQLEQINSKALKCFMKSDSSHRLTHRTELGRTLERLE